MSEPQSSIDAAANLVEDITGEPVKSTDSEIKIISMVRALLTDEQKKEIFRRYESGEIEQDIAEVLLGADEVKDAERLAEGIEVLLNDETTDFVVDPNQ